MLDTRLTNFNNIKENTIIEDMYKISAYYWSKNKVYDRWFVEYAETHNKSRMDVFSDWISNVMFLVCHFKCAERFDANVSTLSTYVYDILRKNESVLAYQILYNMSLNEARLYVKYYKTKTKEERDRFINIKQPLISFDEPVKNDESSLSDSEANDLYNMIADDSIDIQKDIENKDKINNIINYINTTKDLTEKDKEVVLYYIKDDCINYKNTAAHFNISRQLVEQRVNKFRRLIRNKFGVSYSV